MSFLDKAKSLIGQGVDKVGVDKVGEGLDKAGDIADEKTGGKFSDQIDQGVEAAKNEAEKMDGN